jgi:hypothetical protein
MGEDDRHGVAAEIRVGEGGADLLVVAQGVVSTNLRVGIEVLERVSALGPNSVGSPVVIEAALETDTASISSDSVVERTFLLSWARASSSGRSSS